MNNGGNTIGLTTINNLPELPQEFITLPDYVKLVGNTKLDNCGGDNWKGHMFECFDQDTKTYDLEKFNSKLSLLKSMNKRPPKNNGGGSRDKSHYSEKMIETSNKISTIIEGMGVVKCKNGKFWKCHQHMREYVKNDKGKFVMKTTYKPKK